MSYIVIECHGGVDYAFIVQDERTGDNKSFATMEEAQAEANECHDGKVVQI